MIGKVIEIENVLFFVDADKNKLVEIENATKQSDGFHMISGWYIFKTPINLESSVEIKMNKNNAKCRVINLDCTNKN